MPEIAAYARSLSQKRTVVQIILARPVAIKLLIRPTFLNRLRCNINTQPAAISRGAPVMLRGNIGVPFQ
ncbi:hypothetical protein [Cupriavidus pinatubonensis]|uniref:Uncharacterized protein n=1 Tax=Cupriavidus pinatubonensis TaxID=248026 RepID=A0ABN7XRP5_9BURK|nr:hypothetical protein [Cupriavidus pinatubonensis]CAG9163674.1 hypothetical protein LMG23994_00217 [Cupriavidus pinatubonensis]